MSKSSHKTAHYQWAPKGGERCATCTMFRPPAECSAVESPISPEGWCSYFASRASAMNKAARLTHTFPSESQKKSGNYKKGTFDWMGMEIAIENPMGSMRRGVGKDGKPWECKQPAHYGYIKATEAVDGDCVDVFIGHAPASQRVWVIDQIDPDTKHYDEPKAMLSFPTKDIAVACYRRAFSDDKNRVGGVTEMTIPEFMKWKDTQAKHKRKGYAVGGGVNMQDGGRSLLYKDLPESVRSSIERDYPPPPEPSAGAPNNAYRQWLNQLSPLEFDKHLEENYGPGGKHPDQRFLDIMRAPRAPTAPTTPAQVSPDYQGYDSGGVTPRVPGLPDLPTERTQAGLPEPGMGPPHGVLTAPWTQETMQHYGRAPDTNHYFENKSPFLNKIPNDVAAEQLAYALAPEAGAARQGMARGLKTARWLTDYVKERGWKFKNAEGSHYNYVHDTLPGKIQIQSNHMSRTVSPKSQRNIMRMADGLSAEPEAEKAAAHPEEGGEELPTHPLFSDEPLPNSLPEEDYWRHHNEIADHMANTYGPTKAGPGAMKQYRDALDDVINNEYSGGQTPNEWYTRVRRAMGIGNGIDEGPTDPLLGKALGGASLPKFHMAKPSLPHFHGI